MSARSVNVRSQGSVESVRTQGSGSGSSSSLVANHGRPRQLAPHQRHHSLCRGNFNVRCLKASSAFARACQRHRNRYLLDVRIACHGGGPRRLQADCNPSEQNQFRSFHREVPRWQQASVPSATSLDSALQSRNPRRSGQSRPCARRQAAAPPGRRCRRRPCRPQAGPGRSRIADAPDRRRTRTSSTSRSTSSSSRCSRRTTPTISEQWGLLRGYRRHQAPPRPGTSPTAPASVVAVLDTGITNHTDLDANILPRLRLHHRHRRVARRQRPRLQPGRRGRLERHRRRVRHRFAGQQLQLARHPRRRHRRRGHQQRHRRGGHRLRRQDRPGARARQVRRLQLRHRRRDHLGLRRHRQRHTGQCQSGRSHQHEPGRLGYLHRHLPERDQRRGRPRHHGRRRRRQQQRRRRPAPPRPTAPT